MLNIQECKGYVYNVDTLEIKVVVNGMDEKEVEEKAYDYFADDMLGLRYSDCSLVYTEETESI